MTLERLDEIAQLLPIDPLPTLENPDSNPYYHFLYHLAKEMGPA
jgi:hypothetical protein